MLDAKPNHRLSLTQPPSKLNLLRSVPIAMATIGLAMATGCTKPYTGPWNMRELSKAPTFEWVDRTGPVKSLYYAGEPYQGHATRVFAYYAAPENAKGKVPGMVLVHGGGGKAFAEWAELWAKRGYAAIAMDLAGCGPDGKRLSDGGPDQSHECKFADFGKGVKEAWTYHAVAAVIRAHSLLLSMPEVDPQRTGLTGISWGGYLTCICAGLDPRFKVAVPIYGCGFYQDDKRWCHMMTLMPEKDRAGWVANYDPSKYLVQCNIPTLWMNGTNDLAFPLDIYQKSYQLVRGPRTLSVTIGMKHSHPHGWAPKEIGIFTDSVLCGGKPLPSFSRIERNNRQVQASFNAVVPVRTAELIYTTHAGDWKERKWQKAPARIEGNRVAAELPAAKSVVWSITLTDTRDATVSTPHQIISE